MKKIILISFLLLGISNNYSQNITNTLGASGLFSVKAGSTTFLSLNQANGNLSLSNSLMLPSTTDQSTGVIYKFGVRFIHNFEKPGSEGLNTFVGLVSGNFTLGGIYSWNGSNNTAVGSLTLNSLTTGGYNSAFGVGALTNNTTGHVNSAFGWWSLSSNTYGNSNSAFGNETLYSNTTGGANSAFGGNSLTQNTIGEYNSAYGFQSLFFNTTGNNNSAFGNSSLNSNSTGYPNSAYGSFSLFANTTGRENTAVGYKSLWSNVSGFQNTAVGDSALYKNTGSYNTALGYNAGSNVTTGANLTLIGIDANPSSPTAIDQITLGNIYVSSLRCNVQTITSLSDKRDKKNINDLSLGLDFITKLKPRQFNWDKRDWYEGGVSDGSKMQETPTAGFIAQELDELQTTENAEWLDLVLKNNPEKWEATPGNLFPIVVKAIQELNEKNEQLKIENEELKSKVDRFEALELLLVKKLDEIESNSQKTNNLYTQAIQGN